MVFLRKVKSLPILYAMGMTHKTGASCSIFPIALRSIKKGATTSAIVEINEARPQFFVVVYHEGFDPGNRDVFNLFLLSEARAEAMRAFIAGDLKRLGIKPQLRYRTK